MKIPEFGEIKQKNYSILMDFRPYGLINGDNPTPPIIITIL